MSVLLGFVELSRLKNCGTALGGSWGCGSCHGFSVVWLLPVKALGGLALSLRSLIDQPVKEELKLSG